MGESLSRDRSANIATMVNLLPLPDGVNASAHPGMGYEGVMVEIGLDGNYAYFDYTYGGDDGYTVGLRTYVMWEGDVADADWTSPGPPLQATDSYIAGYIAGRVTAIVEGYKLLAR